MKNSYLNLSLWAVLLFLSKPSHQNIFPFPSLPILNPRLLQAYIALQTWKFAITSDPNQFTANWYGHNVCNYTGVYCAPALDDPHTLTVAGIDLNHANIAGFLPEELGLLKDLALFHLNSNRFCGTIPASFIKLHLLYELDISNNQFSGPFPCVILYLPSLKFLDIRFNDFSGEIPEQLFDLNLDALFLNDNKFVSGLPENLGNSPISVFVLANNNIGGCIPPSLARMAETLEEIILSNLGLKGCLRQDIGMLTELKVLDVSCNKLSGSLPESIGEMKNLEQLNVARNKFSGHIPESICSLPNLENFTYSFNYFSSEPSVCLRLPANDDRKNCIPYRPLQRSLEECRSFYSHPVSNCAATACPTS
ncbi:serine-threonine protein kinase, plant-type, putative [Ricinus communis]|uniref:Cell wall hydroxyproline-rich glycoprotein n=1 Tax=Ricinus communis TaxID=3988 RepID=B9RTL4_RICCO|nr:serine-threonine protein kinase, plant-type, putative [Ricinus communis]